MSIHCVTDFKHVNEHYHINIPSKYQLMDILMKRREPEDMNCCRQVFIIFFFQLARNV